MQVRTVSLEASESFGQTRFKRASGANTSFGLRIRNSSNLYSNGARFNETGHKRLDAAEQDITRLIGLINELLDLEKLEAGEIILDLKNIGASSVMDQAQQSVYGFAQQNGVEIVCEPTNLNVMVDQNRFVQVLINLLSNAVKFSEQGAEVRMRTVRGANYTVFEISDTDCGIPAEVQSTIFERYKQAEGANKKHAGTGLGLAICKNIAEQHGGSIGVDSNVGEGSTFWVKIPDQLATS